MLSIIIVTYNSESWIVPCLQSLQRQSSRDFETIVWDNASADATLRKVKSQFPMVHCVASSVNGGYGAGNNAATSLASGNWLLFLNPDTKLHEEFVTEFLACAAGFDGILAPAQFTYDGSSYLTTGNGADVLGYPMGPDTAKRVFYADGAAFGISRSAFESLGGFDEDLFMFHEEIDLCWRAHLAGFGVKQCPNAIVYHQSGGSAAGGAKKSAVYATTSMRRYHGEKNILRNLLKNYGAPNLVWALPVYLIQQCFEIVLMLVLGRAAFARADLSAIIWNAQNIRNTMRKRRAVQRMRRRGDGAILRQMYPGLAKTVAIRTVGVPRQI